MIPLLVPIGLGLLGGYLTKDSDHELFEKGGGVGGHLKSDIDNLKLLRYIEKEFGKPPIGADIRAIKVGVVEVFYYSPNKIAKNWAMKIKSKYGYGSSVLYGSGIVYIDTYKIGDKYAKGGQIEASEYAKGGGISKFDARDVTFHIIDKRGNYGAAKGWIIASFKSLNKASDFASGKDYLMILAVDKNGNEKIIKYNKGGEVVGKRIKMIHMDDPQPIEKGTMGTIIKVDGMGQYMVKWDNGRTLSVIPEEDEFEIIDQYSKGGKFPIRVKNHNFGVGEYRVYGYLRSYDSDAEVRISEEIIALNEDDALKQVLNMYKGASPDSDLIVEMIDSYE